jgi:hypothetical protein
VDDRLTRPLFEEASVFGRRGDKQNIVDVLISASINITQRPPSCIILPIFGLQGIGKTTLAQMVFNEHTHLLQEYNFCVWVHVSLELDFQASLYSVRWCQAEEKKKRSTTTMVLIHMRWGWSI